MSGLLEEVNSNFVLNLCILLIGTITIGYLLVFTKKEISDPSKYNWSKFDIKWGINSKYRSNQGKDKIKTRIKSYRKVIDMDKESSKFPIQQSSLICVNINEQFLSLEEGKRLQDMINYAATIENKEESTVDEVYKMANENKKSSNFKNHTNSKIESEINSVLKR